MTVLLLDLCHTQACVEGIQLVGQWPFALGFGGAAATDAAHIVGRHGPPRDTRRLRIPSRRHLADGDRRGIHGRDSGSAPGPDFAGIAPFRRDDGHRSLGDRDIRAVGGDGDGEGRAFHECDQIGRLDPEATVRPGLDAEEKRAQGLHDLGYDTVARGRPQLHPAVRRDMNDIVAVGQGCLPPGPVAIAWTPASVSPGPTRRQMAVSPRLRRRTSPTA